MAGDNCVDDHERATNVRRPLRASPARQSVEDVMVGALENAHQGTQTFDTRLVHIALPPPDLPDRHVDELAQLLLGEPGAYAQRLDLGANCCVTHALDAKRVQRADVSADFARLPEISRANASQCVRIRR